MLTMNNPSREELLKLKAGDIVMLSGRIFTARDLAHAHFLNNDFMQIKDGIIYHCGPIIKEGKAVSAGPTTSARMNSHTPKLIEKYSIKAIIGKGGMNENVLNSLKGKAVYFSAIGGLGAVYANAIEIKQQHFPEFGITESVWEMHVKDFPLIVGMDAKGNSIYQEVCEKSKKTLTEKLNENK